MPDPALDSEDCGIMNSDGTWSDEACSLSKFGVCSMPRPLGVSQDCGMVNLDGTWTDELCSDTKIGLCEIPKPDGSGADCAVMLADGTWSDEPCDTPRQGLCRSVGVAGAPEPGQYNNWNGGVPGVLGNCARMRQDGTWSASNCDIDYYDAVCVGPQPPASENELVELDQVIDLASCSGATNEWYYSGAAEISLCPTSCDEVKTDRRARISIEIECLPTSTVPIPPGPDGGVSSLPTATSEEYEGVCTTDGDSPTWGNLHYDSETPADSTITFSIRAATTSAGLASATYTELTVVQASSGNELCIPGGVAGCPINLAAALGSPESGFRFVEVEVQMEPGAGGEAPVVNDWEIDYSCLDQQ